MLVSDQEAIDDKLIKADGTENKSNFGANAILAVSMAACKAAAQQKEYETYRHIAHLCDVDKFVLPVPMCNVINGGRHAGQENSIQEHSMMINFLMQFHS